MKLWGQDEEGNASMDICTWEKVKEYFLQTDSYTKLISRKKVYDNVYTNFDDLLEKLEVNSKVEKKEEVENIEGWSLRGSTLDENAKGFLYERILKKLEESEDDKEVEFNLIEKGIYLGKAKIGEENYNLAIYCDKDKSVIKKAQLKDYCELIDNVELNKQIKVTEIEDYLLLAFFKDEKVEMVVQFMSDDDDEFKKLLTAFKILKGEEKFEEESKIKELKIKVDQLVKVFTDTDTVILKDIVNTINTYSKDFGITTKDRMSHFLAQTGYESGGFKDSKGESGCYTSGNTSGWRIWLSLTWKESPFDMDYDASLNTFKKGFKKLPWTSLKCGSTDTSCIEVPLDFVCSKDNPIKREALTKKLFSYVYQCEGGNGNSTSEDGYKYRGHGAIQLTWKKTYVAFDKWLKDNCKESYKDVVANPKLIDENKDLFVLSAMWFWKINNINKIADKGSVRKVTLKINSKGLEWEKRENIFNKLQKEIK